MLPLLHHWDQPILICVNVTEGALIGVSQLMLFGRILTDGRLNARVKADLSENLTLKANAQVNDTFLPNCYWNIVTGIWPFNFFFFLRCWRCILQWNWVCN